MSATEPKVDDAEFATEPIEALELIQPSAMQVYAGMSLVAFSPEQAQILQKPLNATKDVKLRPDGLIYFPEIYYRRRLNEAFGPGAWALQIARIGQNGDVVAVHCRLYAEGRFVAEAIGEASFIPNNPNYTHPTAVESAKSNGLMRCCKDLGIASELWDPDFIKQFLAERATEVWCENVSTGQGAGKKKKLWRLKLDPPIDAWPWRESGWSDGGKKSETKKAAPPPASEPQAQTPPEGHTHWQLECGSLLTSLKATGDKRFATGQKMLAHLIDWANANGFDLDEQGERITVKGLGSLTEEQRKKYATVLGDLLAEQKGK